ncbi:MAG: hypothetical protein ACOCP9_02410 [Halofilum sp. (in: g-proteobacteria)]
MRTARFTTAPARACAIALAALLSGACTNTVIPPAEPADPATAFLLDHGRHASLILESAEGMTRYAWGDWDYYALNRTGPFRASGTLFGANQAGLGRKRLPGPARRAPVRRQVAVPIEALWRIDVPGQRARRLHERLDRRFRAERATLTANPLYDLEFVQDARPYNVAGNSNHRVGAWLRALGCEVRMAGPFSSWRVESPPAGAAGNRGR